MKIRLLIVISIMFFALSCGSDSEETKADKKFGKLKVEIPAELKDKPEVVKYIKDMNVIADDLATLFDGFIEDTGEYVGMKEEDLGLSDKMKLATATAKYATGSAEIFVKWGECTDKRMSLEKDLNDAEINALEKTYERFEERIKQIEERHKKFFEKAKKAAEEQNN